MEYGIIHIVKNRTTSINLLFAAIAFAVSFVVYFPSIRFSFVPQDDMEYVVENFHIRKGFTADNLRWAFTSQHYAKNCEWHPATWLSLMFDVSVSGGQYMDDPEWYMSDNRVAKVMHLHNVLLHAACASLLFILMVILCRGRVEPQWLLGLVLLWAIHPLRTEVVCWISERKEIMSVWGMLLSLMFYSQINRNSQDCNKFLPIVSEPCRAFACYSLAILAFGFALLAKPVAVTLPVVLIAWDWAIQKEIRLIRLIPFFLASLGTCYMTVISQQQALQNGAMLDFETRMTAIFGAPIIYIKQTLYPIHLALFYRGNVNAVGLVIGLGIALVLALVFFSCRWLVLRCRKTTQTSSLSDIIVFGISWIYVGIVPMLGIIKVGTEPHSDRYTYWVGCGLVVCVAMILSEKGQLWRDSVTAWVTKVDGRPFDWIIVRRFFEIMLLIVLLALCVLTRKRAIVWSTPLACIREAIQNSWDYTFAEKLEILARKDGIPDLDEVEYCYRECAYRNPSIGSNLCLARFLLKKPPVESGLVESNVLYTEPWSLLNSVLSAEPNNTEAKELLNRIEEIRKANR